MCERGPWGDKPPKPSLVSVQAAQDVTVPPVFGQKLRVRWGRTGSRASGSSGAVGQLSRVTQDKESASQNVAKIQPTNFNKAPRTGPGTELN